MTVRIVLRQPALETACPPWDTLLSPTVTLVDRWTWLGHICGPSPRVAQLSWAQCFLCLWFGFGVLGKSGSSLAERQLPALLRGRWEAQAVLLHLLPIAMETAGGRDGGRQLGQGCGCCLPPSFSITSQSQGRPPLIP